MNREDGVTYLDFCNWALEYTHVGTYIDGELAGVTIGSFGTPTEVHTYVAKSYRRCAQRIHTSQSEFWYSLGKTSCVTTISDKSRATANYLCKRLGFTRDPKPCDKLTCDGVEYDVYKYRYYVGPRNTP